MIKLFQPYVNLQARENVLRVLSGTQLAEGPEVELFEKEFASRFGYEAWQVVSVNSGTSALELAYHMVDIQEGHDVIAPVLTCTATNIPLVRRKARIIFADVEGKDHLNLDSYDVARKITRRTKAIVFVCFGGSCAGLEHIQRIATERNIDLIVDAAQALGERKVNSDARFTAISLQAIKSLTAGDGGILICRDPEDAQRARRLRWFGYDRKAKQRFGDTDLEEAGYKFHMNDISAAIARGNMLDWETIITHRMHINNVYFSQFLKTVEEGRSNMILGVWNPVVIGLDYKEMKFIAEEAGFEIGQHHFPNNKYAIFRSADCDCPNMKRLKDKYFMLPCHMGVTDADAHHIAETIWP